MLRITDLKLPLNHPDDALLPAIAQHLGVTPDDVRQFTVHKRSYDARKKSAIVLIYAIDVEVADEDVVLKRQHGDRKSVV